MKVNCFFQMEQKDETPKQGATKREEVVETSGEQEDVKEEEEEEEEEEAEAEEGRRAPDEEEEVMSDNEVRGGRGTPCYICGELLDGGHEFIRHLADVHRRNVWCYDCTMGFNYETDFEQHLMQHMWENPGFVVLKDMNAESCGCPEVMRYRDYPSVFD